MGLGFPLDDIFDEVGATANFADAVKKNITVDGEIVKAPVAVHLDGMLFYNKEVAAKAGVDPTAWKSMDDVWADFDKIKAAGLHPDRDRQPEVAGGLSLPRPDGRLRQRHL